MLNKKNKETDKAPLPGKKKKRAVKVKKIAK